MQKDLIAFYILFWALLGFALTETSTKALALSDVPPAVQKTIGANSPGRTVDNIERTENDGEVSYEVETTSKDGEQWDLTVAENGTLLSIELTPAELPPAVQRAITVQVGRGTLEGVAKQFDDGETTYLAGITTADGDERDFILAEDGTLVSAEVSLSELSTAIQTTVNNHVGQGKLEGIDKTFDDGEISYEATMTNPAGQERNFTIADDGTLESEEVSLADLPPAVQAAINAQLGQGKLDGIDETFDGGASTGYGATMTTSTGQKRDFTISDQGTLVSREVWLAHTSPAVHKTITQTIGDGKITRIDEYFGVFPHYEIDGIKDGAPFNFIVGLKGKFRGMVN